MVPRGNLVELYIATESFNDAASGDDVKRGDLVRAGHPLLALHPDKFVRSMDHARYAIEAATARPGELR